MISETGPEQSDSFAYFSSEYAQALQAFAAIEKQAATLMGLGATNDLKVFLQQFVEMASRVKAEADQKAESNFSEWFRELIEKAEALRMGLIAPQS